MQADPFGLKSLNGTQRVGLRNWIWGQVVLGMSGIGVALKSIV